MKNNTKIALIGPTGKAGKYILKELLGQNYQVKALIRNIENFSIKHSNLEVLQGDARIFSDLEDLLNDCQVIISALGQTKGESKPVFSNATKNIIKLIQNTGNQQYIVITGLQVDTPVDQKEGQTQLATSWMKENFKEISQDRQLEYEILAQSNINWTLVRLPLIIQTDQKSPILQSVQNCPGTQISAANLADFLILQISNKQYYQKAPFIADKPSEDG